MPRLARAAVRWWWAVIAFWIGVTALVLLLAPPFESVATYDTSAFLQSSAPAIQGGELLAKGWPDDNFARTGAVVLSRDGKQLTDADRAYAKQLVDWFSSDQAPDVFGSVTSHLTNPELADTFTSDDGQAMFFLVGLDVPPYTPPANEAVRSARDHLAQTHPPQGLQVYVTGAAGVAADENAAINSSVQSTHLITLVLVVLILLWVYRSPVAPIVPLATIGVAYLVALSVVSLLAEAGMQVSSLFETFSIVIVFGAGTDYCLFLLSRYHEELNLTKRAGYARSRNLRRWTLTATLLVLAGVIGSSAMTVIVGFSAQAVAKFGMFRTMGPAMAIAVAVTLLAAMTLTPALMHLFGRWLFWPDVSIAGSHGATGMLLESQAHRLDYDPDELEKVPAGAAASTGDESDGAGERSGPDGAGAR